MKAPIPNRDDNSRFQGHLRHHHRCGPGQVRSWEQWIDEKTAGSPKTSRPWLRAVIILVSLVALGGIITGLVFALS